MAVKTEQLAGEAPRWKLLRVADVKPSPCNPASRTSKRVLKPLVVSMSRIGLLYPILVTSDYTVIDGHRRLAAAKELGWETIAANVCGSGVAAGEIYADVNETARKMSGAEAMQVWMASKKHVSPQRAKLFAAAEAEVGRELLNQMAEAGLSLRTFQIAKRLERYCECNVKDALRWLLETALIGQVQKAMEAGIDRTKLARLISQNKPL